MALEVTNLTKRFRIRKGLRSSDLVAVDDVSFTIEPGRTIALVGESGSGKSTIAKMILRLERPTAGSVTIDGISSTAHGRSAKDYLHLVQMVFQDPFASLNPYHTIGHHIERPLKIHDKVRGRAETRAKVEELLERVNLTPTGDMADLPTNSPAANGSASRSPARWRRVRSTSSRTSPSRCSTSRSGCRC